MTNLFANLWIAALLAPVGWACPAAAPDWVAPMQKVHAEFTGQRHVVAQLGDSITYSMAFWSTMSWSDPSPFLPEDDLPRTPKGTPWKEVIAGARNKGPEFGNYSGWKVGNLLEAVDGVLARDKPAVAIIMIGTNDISGGSVPTTYRRDLKTVLEKCLAARCIPILNTIPPRRDRDEAVKEINVIIRALASELHIPLVDYHGAILSHSPEGKWDGTLISKDGVHPTGGKTQDYSEENLQRSGYALRNWINFMTFREVYFRILAPQP